MSGTALQINGAAYGKGVYISPSAQMSLGYSRLNSNSASTTRSSRPPPLLRTSSNEGNSFLSGRNVKVMALCELIKGNQFIKKNGDIWVVPDDMTMVTSENFLRIFFFYFVITHFFFSFFFFFYLQLGIILFLRIFFDL
jgi:poly [ADP-ribose] polymerase 6/8